MKVFSMNDYDWMAGETLEDCKAEYLKTCGRDEDDAFDDAREVPAAAMTKLMFRREPDECKAGESNVCTFQEELDRLIANGAEFPRFFASTEY